MARSPEYGRPCPSFNSVRQCFGPGAALASALKGGSVPRTSPTRRAGQDHPQMGERLRAVRRARGLSLRELAKQLDVSPSLISQVETGRASPSVSTLYAIAQVLSVSVDDLLFNEADRPQRTSPVRAASTPDQPAVPVQRGTDRSKIRLASGVTWERLTTESIPGIDFLYVIYEVGGRQARSTSSSVISVGNGGSCCRADWASRSASRTISWTRVILSRSTPRSRIGCTRSGNEPVHGDLVRAWAGDDGRRWRPATATCCSTSLNRTVG